MTTPTDITELERLARAAKHDNDSLIVGPAAILELISINRELVAALELQVNFDEHEYSRQVVDNISLRVLDKIGKTISSGSDYTSPELDLELTDDAIKLALMAWFDNKTTDEDAMREAINASIKRSKQ